MSKTAAIILNHNLPEYTDMLYEALKPFERDDYATFVFDNGSTGQGVSKYTAFRSEENGYFGGGFEAARQFVLSNPQFDSMLFLNNDLTVHGMNFVKALRDRMFVWLGGDGDDGPDQSDTLLYEAWWRSVHHLEYDVISPCFFNIEPKGQCHWKTMWNWGSDEVREVPFVDMQAPMMSRRLLEAMGPTDPLLKIGWGIDVYMAHVCNKNEWKMGVVDSVSMLHHNSLTVKRGVAGIDVPTYCRMAEDGQRQFFINQNLVNEFHSIRNAGEMYKCS